MKNKNLINWIFIPTETGWAATDREHYKDFYNNYNSEFVIRSNNFITLVGLIERIEGDPARIKELDKLVK